MMMDHDESDFFSTLDTLLRQCGYRAEEGQVYVRPITNDSSDWLHINGNEFMSSFEVGVAFRSLNSTLLKLLPRSNKSFPLGGLRKSALPFIFLPLNELMACPVYGSEERHVRLLTRSDAVALAEAVCGPLREKLSELHTLALAVDRVEQFERSYLTTLFLLPLAYLELGRLEDAAKCIRSSLAKLPSDNYRQFYASFVKNAEKLYLVDLFGTKTTAQDK